MIVFNYLQAVLQITVMLPCSIRSCSICSMHPAFVSSCVLTDIPIRVDQQHPVQALVGVRDGVPLRIKEPPPPFASSVWRLSV